jgi:hypothetical protein
VVNATPLVKRPGTHCIEGWEGHRAGLDGCEKSRPLPEFDPRTVQPVASPYTYYAIQISREMDVRDVRICDCGIWLEVFNFGSRSIRKVQKVNIWEDLK